MTPTRSLQLILVLLLTGIGALEAQPRLDRGQRMAKELGLSDEQAGKIQDLRARHMKSMIDHQAAIKKARIDMLDLRTSDDPDKNAIKAKLKEIADLRLKAAQARVDHLFEVRAVLTPEQLKKWRSMAGERFPERDGRGMRHPGRRGMRGNMMHEGPGMHREERHRRD